MPDRRTDKKQNLVNCTHSFFKAGMVQSSLIVCAPVS